MPAPVPAVGPPTAQPTSWGQRATAVEWARLADWVDWLIETYTDVIPARAVPACWPGHSGVVEELAALHAAWLWATAESSKDAMIYWHERWLTGTLMRIRTSYQVSECLDGHRSPRRGPLTDHALLLIAFPDADSASGASRGTA